MIVDPKGQITGNRFPVDKEGAVGVEVFRGGPCRQAIGSIHREEGKLETVEAGRDFMGGDVAGEEPVIFDGIGREVFKEEESVFFIDGKTKGAAFGFDFVVGQHDVDAGKGAGGAELLAEGLVFPEEGEGGFVGIVEVILDFEVFEEEEVDLEKEEEG